MRVAEVKKDGLKRTLKVTIEADQIESRVEAELKSAGERVKIPGFRPGFIPMKVLKQRYGKSVQADVIKHAVNDSTIEALKKQDIRPATTPQIKIDESYEEGKDLEFTMEVEAFPNVPDMKFDHITLERQTFEIEEKEIDKSIERIAQSLPNFEDAGDNAKAEKGNVVDINFKGMIDGEAFEGGTAEGFRLELGSGQFIPGFEDQLVGAKKGEERNVEVTFPKEYHAEALAGKPAVFEVKVNAIQTKTLPEIDEAFARNKGFADLRALREAVRDQMMKEYTGQVRTRLKKQLFDQLEDEYEFELPASMVENEFKTIWERVLDAKKQGDESLKDRSEDELKEEYQAIAERRVKLGIMLAEVGTRNKIEVTRDELGRAAMEQASMYPGQEQQVMEFFQKNPERLEDMRGPILEEKAVDYILEQVKYNDIAVSTEELLKDDEEDAPSGDAKKKAKKSSKPAAKKKASSAKKSVAKDKK